MKLRVYLELSNAVTRRRVAALLRADGEVALVGTAGDADLVVSERVVATAAPVAEAGAALTARETVAGERFSRESCAIHSRKSFLTSSATPTLFASAKACKRLRSRA